MVQIHALPLQFLKYFYDTDKGGMILSKKFHSLFFPIFNFTTIKLFNRKRQYDVRGEKLVFEA